MVLEPPLNLNRIVTDRFSQPTPEQALTKDLVANCDPKAGSWCGGNWRSIIDKLDYIKNMG
jgi:alpha-amylase